MLCAARAMLDELDSEVLDGMGFQASAGQGEPGDYVIRKGFL